jgi:hypothetical protein
LKRITPRVFLWLTSHYYLIVRSPLNVHEGSKPVIEDGAADPRSSWIIGPCVDALLENCYTDRVFKAMPAKVVPYQKTREESMMQRRYTRSVALGVLTVSLFSSGLVFAADKKTLQEITRQDF